MLRTLIARSGSTGLSRSSRMDSLTWSILDSITGSMRFSRGSVLVRSMWGMESLTVAIVLAHGSLDMFTARAFDGNRLKVCSNIGKGA